MCGTVNFLIKALFNIQIVTGVVIVLSFFSCMNAGSDEELCQYSDRIRVKMEIIEVRPNPEKPATYDVVLEFNQSFFAQEPQLLGELRKEEITDEYLELNPFIQPGTTLTGYVFEVIEGNCETSAPAFDQKFRSPD